MAQASDIPEIVLMGEKFHDYHSPKWPYSKQDMSKTIGDLIQSENGFVAIGGGFIAGVIVPNPISPTWHIAKEFLWWSDGKSGIRLLTCFRDWARSRGVNEIQYSRPSGSVRVGRFFDRLGPTTEIIHSEFCNVS